VTVRVAVTALVEDAVAPEEAESVLADDRLAVEGVVGSTRVVVVAQLLGVAVDTGVQNCDHDRLVAPGLLPGAGDVHAVVVPL
jgi:hypothetical protein